MVAANQPTRSGIGRPITELWAWVVDHGPNEQGEPDEGIFAMSGRGDMFLPAITADRKIAEMIGPGIQAMAKSMGVKVSLKKFALQPSE